ncbi:MAG: hypothetical protein FJ319_09970 [SAR202 cluster bacterium]|nr:hypothetical protein [SAR202 cluster bacterium]
MNSYTTLTTITATQTAPPPTWAILERRLFDLNEDSVRLVMEKYYSPSGFMYYADDVDDLYERIQNWGLFYAMGGHKDVLTSALLSWNATTRSNAGPNTNPIFDWYLPQTHNEYYCLWNQKESTWIPGRRMVNEWHHQGEGNMAIYHFGLGIPTDPENHQRARRFAAMFMGDDPEAPNWDPKHKIIRSPFQTSKGPVFAITTPNVVAFLHGSRAIDRDPGYRFKPMGVMSTLRPVVKDLEEGWWLKVDRANEIANLFNKIILNGDIANNLAVTSLITNAYLYTGDDKYKNWVTDYVQVWMDRIKKNNGIIPDNVGPTGKIGEMREGQWWGGLFGWSYYMGYNIIFHGLTAAAEAALMMTGDNGYLDLLRSQIKVLLDNSRKAENGQLLTPVRYDEDGWYFGKNKVEQSSAEPMRLKDLAHLYHASLSAEDRQLITRVRDSDVTREWNKVLARDEKDQGETEMPRFQYYDGKNPTWPTDVLSVEYERALEFNVRAREEQRTVEELVKVNYCPPNPVVTKGLTQVMFGAPHNVYNGTLLRATVRYFDADRKRAGLPQDVAALVDEIKADKVGVNLVNLSRSETRNVILQAGAFGEHSFTEIRGGAGGWVLGTGVSDLTQHPTPSTQHPLAVHGQYFTVTLPPSTSIRLEAGMKRFVNKPSYAHPWHGGKITIPRHDKWRGYTGTLG